MRLSLLVIRGVHEGEEILVTRSHFCIGRDETCDLRAQSMAVSRRHAALLVQPGKVVVCDLGSRNGTFINEVPVTGEREVRHNDRLRIGPLEFRVQVRPPVPCAGQPTSAAEAIPVLPCKPDPDDSTSRHRPLSDGPRASFSSPAGARYPEWVFPSRGTDLLKQYLRRPHS